MKTATEHHILIDVAIYEALKAKPPTYHRVFDKVYVRLTPEVGALMCLMYPDFEIREGIRADE